MVSQLYPIYRYVFALVFLFVLPNYIFLELLQVLVLNRYRVPFEQSCRLLGCGLCPIEGY